MYSRICSSVCIQLYECYLSRNKCCWRRQMLAVWLWVSGIWGCMKAIDVCLFGLVYLTQQAIDLWPLNKYPPHPFAPIPTNIIHGLVCLHMERKRTLYGKNKTKIYIPSARYEMNGLLVIWPFWLYNKYNYNYSSNNVHKKYCIGSAFHMNIFNNSDEEEERMEETKQYPFTTIKSI